MESQGLYIYIYIYYKTCRGIFLRVQQNLLLQSCWVFAHFAPKLSENRILKRRNDATKADTKIFDEQWTEKNNDVKKHEGFVHPILNEWIQALIIVPCRRFQVSPHQAPFRRPSCDRWNQEASEACKTRWLFPIFSIFTTFPWGNDPMWWSYYWNWVETTQLVKRFFCLFLGEAKTYSPEVVLLTLEWSQFLTGW